MALTQINQDGLSANALQGIQATLTGSGITTTTNSLGQTILVIETLSPFMLAGM
jgi:hypothetical protein